MKNQDEYDSSWQWCVDHSNYHFDNRRVEKTGEWFQVLGRFVGNWTDEVQQAGVVAWVTHMQKKPLMTLSPAYQAQPLEKAWV